MNPTISPTVLTEVSSNCRIATATMIQQIPAISQSHQYLVTSRVHARSPDVTGGVPPFRRTVCRHRSHPPRNRRRRPRRSPSSRCMSVRYALVRPHHPELVIGGAVGHGPLVHSARAHEGEVAALPVVSTTCRTPGRCNGRTRPAQPTSAPSERMRRWSRPARPDSMAGRDPARGRLQSNPHGATPQRCSRTRERWGRPASILRPRQARATRGPVRRPSPFASRRRRRRRHVQGDPLLWSVDFRGRPAAPRTELVGRRGSTPRRTRARRLLSWSPPTSSARRTFSDFLDRTVRAR